MEVLPDAHTGRQDLIERASTEMQDSVGSLLVRTGATSEHPLYL
jgi:hypothetical protein